jgi:hypothetical protein
MTVWTADSQEECGVQRIATVSDVGQAESKIGKASDQNRDPKGQWASQRKSVIVKEYSDLKPRPAEPSDIDFPSNQ